MADLFDRSSYLQVYRVISDYFFPIIYYHADTYLVERIKLLSVLASKPGLEKITTEFPGLEVRTIGRLLELRLIPTSISPLQIWTAAMDSTLTAEGIISPGLGDTVRPTTHLVNAY